MAVEVSAVTGAEEDSVVNGGVKVSFVSGVEDVGIAVYGMENCNQCENKNILGHRLHKRTFDNKSLCHSKIKSNEVQ